MEDKEFKEMTPISVNELGSGVRGRAALLLLNCPEIGWFLSGHLARNIRRCLIRLGLYI